MQLLHSSGVHGRRQTVVADHGGDVDPGVGHMGDGRPCEVVVCSHAMVGWSVAPVVPEAQADDQQCCGHLYLLGHSLLLQCWRQHMSAC